MKAIGYKNESLVRLIKLKAGFSIFLLACATWLDLIHSQLYVGLPWSV